MFDIIPYTSGVLAVISCTLTFGYFAPADAVDKMAVAMKGKPTHRFHCLMRRLSGIWTGAEVFLFVFTGTSLKFNSAVEEENLLAVQHSAVLVQTDRFSC